MTGHTGFKGSWLCEWLLALGARPFGYALAPDSEPALFRQLDLATRMDHVEADVCDLAALSRRVREVQPDVVLHLAAQPLVRRSYAEPVATIATNVLGTTHLLETLRGLDQPCAVVIVTSDKCYENREWLAGYREEDPLGGHDPYSASKACAELVTRAYGRSFFAASDTIGLATARAGNVIGGGDWAADRIVPDCIRALLREEAIGIRNPGATRPWQHVLEPLSGYLWLARSVHPAAADCRVASPGEAFNFGPGVTGNATVRELVETLLRHWPGTWQDQSESNTPHEAGRLNLAVDKAWQLLGWRALWDLPAAVQHTVQWYRRVTETCAAADVTREQIAAYTAAADRVGLDWARGNAAAPAIEEAPAAGRQGVRIR